VGLFNRLRKRRDAGVLVGSLGDLAATLNVMKVQDIKSAVAQGEFDVRDVVAAEASPQGKKRKGVLALG
jgi:hypothetical protein